MAILHVYFLIKWIEGFVRVIETLETISHLDVVLKQSSTDWSYQQFPIRMRH